MNNNFIKVWTMKLPKYSVWGKIHIAPDGGKTLCGTIERDHNIKVESGDYIRNMNRFLKKKNVCKTCARLVK